MGPAASPVSNRHVEALHPHVGTDLDEQRRSDLAISSGIENRFRNVLDLSAGSKRCSFAETAPPASWQKHRRCLERHSSEWSPIVNHESDSRLTPNLTARMQRTDTHDCPRSFDQKRFDLAF